MTENKKTQNKIIAMFNNIAPTYDKANHVMSMGIDKSWRKKAVKLVYELYKKEKIDLIVDVACGTGDMMSTWEKGSKKKNLEISEIRGIDLSEGMISVGKQKFPNMNFVIGDAANLPIEDNKADILSIAYGIRNVIERKKAFQEFYRVLKPGGILTILEFTKSDKKLLTHSIRDFYMAKVIPKVGGFISKNKEAYNYLPNSIGNFLTPESLISELEELGFKIEFNKGYSMNMSTLFIAKK